MHIDVIRDFNGAVVYSNLLSYPMGCHLHLVFTKVLKPVYAHLRQLGHIAAGYIDDSFIMALSYDSCIDSRPAKLGRVKTSRFTRTTKMRHPSTYDDAKCATRAAVTNIHVYQY